MRSPLRGRGTSEIEMDGGRKRGMGQRKSKRLLQGREKTGDVMRGGERERGGGEEAGRGKAHLYAGYCELLV